MNWYLKCLKQYADFNGRARRTEYWMFVLVNFIISLVLTWLLGFPILSYIYSVAVFIPGLAVCVRRMHDINKSGWWVLINLIPFIGNIWFIVLALSDSVSGENVYGPNPKGL